MVTCAIVLAQVWFSHLRLPFRWLRSFALADGVVTTKSAVTALVHAATKTPAGEAEARLLALLKPDIAAVL